MVDILQIQKGVWVLEEEGQSVLVKDSVRYGITKAERKNLLQILSIVAEKLELGESLEPLIGQEFIKKLTRQEKTKFENIWEVRDPGINTRIIFIIEEPDSTIVAAVDKSQGSLSQAINRGVNRWREFLKTKEK